ncbi:MAG: hypothetical protein WBP72_17820 [Rhodocyclaceae bacterium]
MRATLIRAWQNLRWEAETAMSFFELACAQCQESGEFVQTLRLGGQAADQGAPAIVPFAGLPQGPGDGMQVAI